VIFKYQYVDLNLLHDPINRVVQAKTESARRKAHRIKNLSVKARKAYFESVEGVEVITVSAGYSYE
jgi:hypothetical protein